MKLSTITALTTAIATTTIGTIAIAPAANAGTLISNSPGVITSIEDLFIDGYGTYDVTFHSGTFDDVFDTMAPTFLNDLDGGIAAAEAIIDILGDTLVIAESSQSQPSDGFAIPIEGPFLFSGFSTILSTGELSSTAPASDNRVTGNGLADTPIGQGTNVSVSWAKFTPSGSSDPTPVPEPTALLGLGLALGLSTLKRRRNQDQ
ncbi:MAG: PEP-CTERM sorting domain-containing protein [Cyanobacteria bacterium P01_H01_bin.130]